MKTNKMVTYNALNSHYLDTSDNKVNAEYLNDAIIMWGMNTQKFYNAVYNKRRPVTSVVWEVFTDLVNHHIKTIEYPYNQDCYASSSQLKSWLNEYGEGYDTLNAALDHFETERREGLV